MISVLDACAMIAYLEGEPGAATVEVILEEPSAVCYAHSINLCEVYYHFLRVADEPTAELAIDLLFASGVTERSDMGRIFWQRVARHKGRGRIALADCICLALAEEVSGQVVTSDHGEFDPLVPLGICPILFIR